MPSGSIALRNYRVHFRIFDKQVKPLSGNAQPASCACLAHVHACDIYPAESSGSDLTMLGNAGTKVLHA